MTYPITITRSQLVELDACSPSLDAFDAVAPDGVLAIADVDAHDQLEHWAGPDAGDGTVPRDEVLAVMGRTIADLRSQFGDAARVVFDVGQALMAAGFRYESDGRADQPPRPDEMAGCIRILHESVTRAEREQGEAIATLDRIHDALAKHGIAADGWEGLVRAVELTAADRTSYAAELADHITRLHAARAEAAAAEATACMGQAERCARAERERDGALRQVAVLEVERDTRTVAEEGRNGAALIAISNILYSHGSPLVRSLDGIVQGVATELERRDERVRELKEEKEARDKVSRMVADLRDHSLHAQLEALQAEELRLLRLVARLVEGDEP